MSGGEWDDITEAFTAFDWLVMVLALLGLIAVIGGAVSIAIWLM